MFFTSYVELKGSDFDVNKLGEKSWLVGISLFSGARDEALPTPMSVKIAGGETESELWLIARDAEASEHIASCLPTSIASSLRSEPFIFAAKLGQDGSDGRRLYFVSIESHGNLAEDGEAPKAADFNVATASALDDIRRRINNYEEVEQTNESTVAVAKIAFSHVVDMVVGYVKLRLGLDV